MVLAFMTKQPAMTQSIQVTPRNWAMQGEVLPKSLQEAPQPCQHLDPSPARSVSDFRGTENKCVVSRRCVCGHLS